MSSLALPALTNKHNTTQHTPEHTHTYAYSGTKLKHCLVPECLAHRHQMAFKCRQHMAGEKCKREGYWVGERGREGILLCLCLQLLLHLLQKCPSRLPLPKPKVMRVRDGEDILLVEKFWYNLPLQLVEEQISKLYKRARLLHTPLWFYSSWIFKSNNFFKIIGFDGKWH